MPSRKVSGSRGCRTLASAEQEYPKTFTGCAGAECFEEIRTIYAPGKVHSEQRGCPEERYAVRNDEKRVLVRLAQKSVALKKDDMMSVRRDHVSGGTPLGGVRDDRFYNVVECNGIQTDTGDGNVALLHCSL